MVLQDGVGFYEKLWMSDPRWRGAPPSQWGCHPSPPLSLQSTNILSRACTHPPPTTTTIATTSSAIQLLQSTNILTLHSSHLLLLLPSNTSTTATTTKQSTIILTRPALIMPSIGKNLSEDLDMARGPGHGQHS